MEKEDYDKAAECLDKAMETGFEVPQELLDELASHRQEG
jgi:hypothetical protein